MKRPIFLLALSFLPWLLFAQQEVLERGFGLELYPNLSDRRLAGGSDLIFDELAALDSLENGRFGYGFGLVYDNRTDKLGYTVGLRYTHTGYRTLEQPVGDPFDNIGFRVSTSSNFVSLPLEINFFQDIDEKNRVMFFLGVAANYHLSTRLRRQEFEDGRETDDRRLPESSSIDYRPVQFSVTTGVGYDRLLGERIALRLQPDVRFFLSSNTTRNDIDRVSRNYYQLGLRATFRWIRQF